MMMATMNRTHGMMMIMQEKRGLTDGSFPSYDDYDDEYDYDDDDDHDAWDGQCDDDHVGGGRGG